VVEVVEVGEAAAEAIFKVVSRKEFFRYFKKRFPLLKSKYTNRKQF
jgi:hypothetical protein